MTNKEKIEILRLFKDNTELGEGIHQLLDAAYTLNGIAYTNETEILISVVEIILKDFFAYICDFEPGYTVDPKLRHHLEG